MMDSKGLKIYLEDYLKPKVFKLLPLAQYDRDGYIKHRQFLLVQLEGAVSYNESITRLVVVRNNIKGLSDADNFATIRKIVLDSCQDLQVIIDEL